LDGENPFDGASVLDLGSGDIENFEYLKNFCIEHGALKVNGVERFNTKNNPKRYRELGVHNYDMLDYLRTQRSNSLDVITINSIDWCIVNNNKFMPKLSKEIQRVLNIGGWCMGTNTWWTGYGGLELYNLEFMTMIKGKKSTDLGFHIYKKEKKNGNTD